MKNRATGIMALVMLLMVGLMAPAAAEFRSSNGPEDCDGTWVPPTYTQVVDQEAWTEIVEEAHWQRWSWTPKGNVLDQDEAPTVVPPHENWQANVQGDPHGIGQAGPYDVSRGSSGRSDWFYLEYVDAVIIDHPATYKDVVDEAGYCIPEPVLERTVRPILECVAPGVEGGYIAYFGYRNDSTFDGEPIAVTIEVGDSNKFTPAPQDREQPNLFAPGRTYYVDDGGVFKPENAAVAVPFDGSDLVWTLDGRTSTASSNSKACPEAPVDDAFTITVSKEWYDVEGDLIIGETEGLAWEPEGLDWGIQIYTSDGAADVVQATLPGDGTFVVGDGEPVRYGVRETPLAGWVVADCGDLTETVFDEQGVRTTGDDGSWTEGDTFHLVCNQQVEEQVAAACPPGTIPVPGSDPLVCVRTVTDTVVRDRIIEREVIIEVPGETIIEEVIVEVEVPVEVEVLPEVIEAEPEAEPVVVAPEVEVRGVTVTRTVPTGIDAGTGGLLPRSTPTAALLLLVLGGLALTAGATASLVRRRG